MRGSKSGSSSLGSTASTNSPVPGLSGPPVNHGASSDQLAPDRPAASTSTISAMLAPRWPPNASMAPFMAAAGSVVGLPLASSAQPSGMVLPSSAAFRMLTKAVALDDWSMTSCAPSAAGAANDIGLVQ